MALWSVPICLYREAMHLQCFPPTRYVKNGEYPLGMRTYYADDLYPIWSNLEYRLPACIVYSSTMHPARLCGVFRTIFFRLSVWSPWKKQQKLHALECATGCTSWICNSWTAGLMAASKIKTSTSMIGTWTHDQWSRRRYHVWKHRCDFIIMIFVHYGAP